MPKKVIVEPHNHIGRRWLPGESKRIARALGPNVVAIHHIGSTAIPTIHAKPIIDMLIEVAEINGVDACNAAMEALGYEGLGEFGIPGRRFFRKDDAAGIRTHHIHAFAAGSPKSHVIWRFAIFCSRIVDWAQRCELKRQLAAEHADSIERYMDGKDAFIKEIDRMAAALAIGAAV